MYKNMYTNCKALLSVETKINVRSSFAHLRIMVEGITNKCTYEQKFLYTKIITLSFMINVNK